MKYKYQISEVYNNLRVHYDHYILWSGPTRKFSGKQTISFYNNFFLKKTYMSFNHTTKKDKILDYYPNYLKYRFNFKIKYSKKSFPLLNVHTNKAIRHKGN